MLLLLGIISISLVNQVSADWTNQDNQTSPHVIIDAPAYVNQNQIFQIIAHTYNASGQLESCTNGGGPEEARLYLKDNSDGSMLLNGQPMSLLGVGRYTYNISVPKQSIYYAYATCVIQHVPYPSNPKAITSMNVPVDINIPQTILNPCRHLKLGYYNKHLVFDKQMGCYDPDEI
jgi:hypothetical protein